jgi:hypothetical protein
MLITLGMVFFWASIKNLRNSLCELCAFALRWSYDLRAFSNHNRCPLWGGDGGTNLFLHTSANSD